MDATATETLRTLIKSTSVGSLGTIAPDGPQVSMVPVAIDETRLLIHVSGLAEHTSRLRANPSASVMIMQPETAGSNPLALPRISFAVEASEVVRDSADHARAKEIYLRRHPRGEMLFGFGDFALFELRVSGARFVAGFGSAFDVSRDEFAEVVSGLVPLGPV